MTPVKGTLKRILALLLLCLLLVPLCAGSALAVNLDTECSLVIGIQEVSGVPSPSEIGVVIDLYYVAGADYVEGYDAFTLKPLEVSPFSALTERMLVASAGGNSEWDSFAQEALQIALACGAYAGSWPVTPVQSGVPFGLEINGLKAGTYLVLAHGQDMERYIVDYIREYTDENGDTQEVTEYATFARDAEYDYWFTPVLVTIPEKLGNGDWLYEGTPELKMEPHERAKKKIVLHKVGDDGKSLPGAEFKLYATRLADPDKGDITDTITTYVTGYEKRENGKSVYEGMGYVTLFCQGTYTTDRNGDIIIEAPLKDDSTLYAWVETKAPAGYEITDDTPLFFFAYGMIRPEDYAQRMQDLRMEMRVFTEPERFNATGSRVIQRRVEGKKQIISFVNEAEDGNQRVYVRAKALDSCEGITDEQECLGFFSAEQISGEDWTYGGDGFYYYDCILEPGASTSELTFTIEGDEVEDADGKILSNTFRVPILYDFTPVQYDENGNPYADWGLEIEAEENGLVPSLQPFAVVRPGGPGITSTDDVKITGTPYMVRSSHFEMGNERNSGLTVTNKKRNENPPDEPGVELPSTGGKGTFVFFLAGGGLIALASFLLVIKKRRRA